MLLFLKCILRMNSIYCDSCSSIGCWLLSKSRRRQNPCSKDLYLVPNLPTHSYFLHYSFACRLPQDQCLCSFLSACAVHCTWVWWETRVLIQRPQSCVFFVCHNYLLFPHGEWELRHRSFLCGFFLPLQGHVESLLQLAADISSSDYLILKSSFLPFF